MVTASKEPKSTGQILSQGIQLWKATFVKALPFALLEGIINIASQYSVGHSMNLQPIPSVAHDNASQMALTPPHFEWTQLSVLIFMVATIIIHAGMIYRIHKTVQKSDVGFDKAFYFACKKTLPLIGVYLLTVLAVSVGFILFIIPGFIALVYLFFAPFLMVIKNVGVEEALKGSYHLVSGYFWHTFFTFFAIVILYTFLVAFISLIFSFNIFITAGIVVVLYPLMTTCLLALFYDLQNRKNNEKEKGPTHRIAA